MKKIFQTLIAALTVGAFAAGSLVQASAQNAMQSAAQAAWPSRPVRLIIPLGPGAGVDVTARLVAEKLQQKWGQPVVVENRPGGDSIVAITAVIGANDDHILLMAPASSFTAHPYLHETLPYKFSDLQPIARVTNTIVVVTVPASLGVNNVEQLAAKIKAEPGKLNWATATGANDLMWAAWLKSRKLEMAKVPYKNTVDAVTDLAENRIQGYVGAYAIVRTRVQDGKVKIIAVSNSKRVPSLPDVPTSIEAGHPELTLDGLVGILGPKTVTEAVQNKIAADVAEVMKDEDIVKRVTATGSIVSPGSPKEFAQEINSQRETVAKMGVMLGVKSATEK